MAGPRQVLGAVEHGDDGRGAGFGDDEVGGCARSPCGTRKRQSASGSATVADRPIAVRCGAIVCSRARPSESRSPRFEVTSACSSSSTTRRRPAEEIRRVGAGAEQRELLRRGEQDVGRIVALALALRRRRVAGAGLDADGQAHLGDRALQVALDVDRERLQRRDVERVQTLADVRGEVAILFPRAARSLRSERTGPATSPRCATPPAPSPLGGRVGVRGDKRRWTARFPLTPSAFAALRRIDHRVEARGQALSPPGRGADALAQFHQRRQKAGERLAGAGRRDQQRRAAGSRLRQEVELMRPRRPAARREPARERLRQIGSAFAVGHGAISVSHRDDEEAGNRRAAFVARRT